MIVNDIEGNVFDELVSGDAIAHGANCVGVMGAGVAKPIKDTFPINYNRYKHACDKGLFVPGDYLYTNEYGVGIFNLATQFKPGPNAKIEYIRSSAKKMVLAASVQDYSVIKTVRLGCGIGGLNWSDVKPVLEEIPSSITLDVYYI